MKTRSFLSVLKGTVFSILLLTILGVAVDVSAQPMSRATIDKQFCTSIGASNTCNGTPSTFPANVTFHVDVGTYDPVTNTWTGVASADVVVPIGSNANGSLTAAAQFTPGVWLRVCEEDLLGWVEIPRPDSSGGGGSQFGVDNCLFAQLGNGNNQLKFINGPGGATAGEASIAGRVLDANGAGVSSARLMLVNAETGETKSALSNPFGYYSFADVDVGQLYVLSISHKRYRFTENQRVLSVGDSMTDIDFVVMPTKH